MEAITIVIGKLTGCIGYRGRPSVAVPREGWVLHTASNKVKVRAKCAISWLLHQVRDDGFVRIYPILRGAWKD